jgi:hypothetical protein
VLSWFDTSAAIEEFGLVRLAKILLQTFAELLFVIFVVNIVLAVPLVIQIDAFKKSIHN